MQKRSPLRTRLGSRYWSRPAQACVLLAVVAVTAVAAPGALRILQRPQENILDSHLPPNRLTDGIEAAAAYVPKDSATVMVVVEAREKDLLAPGRAGRLEALTERLNALEFVDAARTRAFWTTSTVFETDGVYRSVSKPFDELPVLGRDAWTEQVSKGYAYGRLISTDWRSAVVVLGLKEPFAEIAASDALRAVAADFDSPEMYVGVTGPRVLNAEISVLVKQQIRELFPIALVAIFGFFALFLGSALGGFICFATIGVAIE